MQTLEQKNKLTHLDLIDIYKILENEVKDTAAACGCMLTLDRALAHGVELLKERNITRHLPDHVVLDAYLTTDKFLIKGNVSFARAAQVCLEDHLKYWICKIWHEQTKILDEYI
jgi:hypothetical protein